MSSVAAIDDQIAAIESVAQRNGGRISKRMQERIDALRRARAAMTGEEGGTIIEPTDTRDMQVAARTPRPTYTIAIGDQVIPVGSPEEASAAVRQIVEGNGLDPSAVPDVKIYRDGEEVGKISPLGTIEQTRPDALEAQDDEPDAPAGPAGRPRSPRRIARFRLRAGRAPPCSRHVRGGSPSSWPLPAGRLPWARWISPRRRRIRLRRNSRRNRPSFAASGNAGPLTAWRA